MKHNTSTTSTSKKRIVSRMAIGLALTLAVVGGGLLSHRYSRFDDSPTAELPTEPPKSPETGDTVTVTPGIQRGIKLTTKAFTTERGTTAQLITATITPEDTANKTVDWKIGFVNPAASWATGKKAEDYVTMSPNGSQATVECSQAFGEQIAITVTAAANTDVTAECTLDYYKRVTDITFSAKKTGATYTGSTIDFTDKVNEAATYSFTYTPVYSVYTVDDTFTASATLEATQTMLDKFTAYAKKVDSAFDSTYSLTKGTNPGGTGTIQGNYYELLNSIISFNRVSSGARIDFGNAEKRTDVVEWNKFVRLFKGFTADKTYNTEFMRLNVTYTGNHSVYSDYVSYKLGTEADILPESITTDKNNIIF